MKIAFVFVHSDDCIVMHPSDAACFSGGAGEGSILTNSQDYDFNKDIVK